MEVQEQAQQLVEKFKAEEESRTFLIDRRMITGFLVQYANPKASNATRKSMLDAMGKILCFSEGEKTELGMTVPDRPKMRESLVNFLMGDDDL